MQRGSKRLAVLVGSLAILPAFTGVRLGSLQLIDLLSLILFGLCAAKFIGRGFTLRIDPNLRNLLCSYGLFVPLIVAMSVLALRLTFTPIEGAGFLKAPGIFSLSKLLQLTANICGFLWLSNTLLMDRALLRMALKAYWLAGVFSALYATGCYIMLANLHLVPFASSLFGAYAPDEGIWRAKGFFNEGGPFGLYLVSVMAAGLVYRHLTGRRLRRMAPASLFVFIAFFLAASKAGFLVAAALFLGSILSVASVRQKIAYLFFSLVLLVFAGLWLDIGNQLIESYLYNYQNIEEVAVTHADDLNVVAGRISALYIVPRMIAAHPFAGIGFGNYPLMRNNPEYLGILPVVSDFEDLPGIGFPAIAAEIGVPATVWLIFLLCVPFIKCRKSATVIAVAAVFQPIAHACGVQLTFFYPWFLSACAIAAANSAAPVRANATAPMRASLLGEKSGIVGSSAAIS